MIPSDPPPVGAETSARDTVLLIDDERPLLDMYCAALSPSFDVMAVLNTREADALVRQRRFKVVIADHLMPGETGMNFLVRMREEFPHMQRILVTGYMKPDLLLRGVTEAALFRYLSKPVRMIELVQVIQDAVKAHDTAVATGDEA